MVFVEKGTHYHKLVVLGVIVAIALFSVVALRDKQTDENVGKAARSKEGQEEGSWPEAHNAALWLAYSSYWPVAYWPVLWP